MENQNKYFIESENIYKINVNKNQMREERHESNQKILEQMDNININ